MVLVWAGGLRGGRRAGEEGEPREGTVGLPGADPGLQGGDDGALGPVQGGHSQGEDAARRTLVESRNGAGMAVGVDVGLGGRSRSSGNSSGGGSTSSGGDSAWVRLFRQ